MLYFALFVLGYFVGVVTCLYIFPPNTKEIKEQEIDALQPILDMDREARLKGEEVIRRQPAISS